MIMDRWKALAIAVVWIGVGMCGIGAGIHGGDGTAFVGVFFVALCAAHATSSIGEA